MDNYLGEITPTDDQNPFLEFTPREWALEYIERYGGIDGSHHKDWVLDQVSRILHGTEVIVTLARWGTEGKITLQEARFTTGEPSDSYHGWVRQLRAGEDGPETFDYEFGIAP